ncbi:DMT family transporter [Desulfosediminicola flagellatus]|uniref:DMT family transporter n=1 Tax=Desulfosediminicola flagellatus TaxID=2569541 RepID=UPI001E4A677F|nr:DMT family transporter [Desulfosediminicola flagellatus]
MRFNPKPSALSLFFNPIIMVLCGAFLISFSAVWVKVAGVPATTSAFYRVFFGFLFLLPATLAIGELRKYPKAHIRPITLCGIAFAFDLVFWHASINYIGPGLATIIGNFQVFLMAACGVVFYGEKLKKRFLLALPLAITGLFMVIGFNFADLSANYRLGVFFGLMTAICYTVYLILLRNIQSTPNTHFRFAPLMFISLISSLSLAPAMLATDTSFAIPSVSSGLALLCLGLFSQCIGWVMIASAMPRINASLTGLILLLQPSLSFLWDVLIFGRPTSSLQWLGVTVTLAAIYMGFTGSRRK